MTSKSKIEGETRGTVEVRSEAFNCLSIQGEGRGRKEKGGGGERQHGKGVI